MEQYAFSFAAYANKVISGFINQEVKVQNPYYLYEGKDIEPFDIATIIDFSEGINGKLILGLSQDVAQKIGHCFFPKIENKSVTIQNKDLYNSENDENFINDVICEMINNIAGNAKLGLENDFKFKISLPTITKKLDYLSVWDKNSNVIAIPIKLFESDTVYLLVKLDVPTKTPSQMF